MYVAREKTDGRVYVVATASGEVVCEVLGNVGVDRMGRAELIAAGLRALDALRGVDIHPGFTMRRDRRTT